MAKRKRYPKCVVCGAKLCKRRYLARGWVTSELQAHMYASQVNKVGRRPVEVKVRTVFDDPPLYYTAYMDGGGWRGLGKVCGGGKCLERFVRRAKLPEKKEHVDADEQA